MRVFLLVVASLVLAGCTPTWRDAVDASSAVAQSIACAVCGPAKPLPAPPAVDPDKTSREDAARLLAWSAAIIAILQSTVQRPAVEVLAQPNAAPK
jgi:hypothetical protein